jgi:hypothetical protein
VSTFNDTQRDSERQLITPISAYSINGGSPTESIYRYLKTSPELIRIFEEDIIRPSFLSPPPADLSLLFQLPYQLTTGEATQLSSLINDFRIESFYCHVTAARMAHSSPPTAFLRERVQQFVARAKDSSVLCVDDFIQSDVLLYSTVALCSIITTSLPAEGLIYFQMALDILRSTVDLRNMEYVKCFCQMSLFCVGKFISDPFFRKLTVLARGSFKAGYLLFGIAFRLADLIHRLQSEQPSAVYHRVWIFMQSLDTHFSFFFGVPQLIRHDHNLFERSSVRSGLLQSAMIRMTQLLAKISRFESKHSSLQQSPARFECSNRIYELMNIDRELREFYQSLPSFVTSSQSRFAFAWSDQDRFGTISTDAVYLLILYHFGVFRLHSVKFKSLMKVFSMDKVHMSMSASIMNQCVAEVTNLLKRILHSDPHLQFYSPFLVFVLYEVSFVLTRLFLLSVIYLLRHDGSITQ